MEENKTNAEEQNFRVNIKQTAKGMAYFDVTCRAETEEQLKERLDKAIDVAVTRCEIINKNNCS